MMRGARSGGRLWGCEEPVSQMEWLIPYPFRPGALTQQGVQVTKHISPVHIGKPERGPAAVLREVAVPRGDCCEEHREGERVESAKERAAKIADTPQSG